MIQHRFNLSKWHDHDSKLNEYATDSGKVKNTALFVQDEYKMNDKVTMYAGLRYDNYKKAMDISGKMVLMILLVKAKAITS